MPEVDYVIARKRRGDRDKESTELFTVAKFIEGEESPSRVYTVRHTAGDYWKCDCPAAAFRGTGRSDKHVQMVIKWLETNANRQIPPIDLSGVEG
jgi:hypothetical protein